MRRNSAYAERIVWLVPRQLRKLIAAEGPLSTKQLQRLQQERPRTRADCINGVRPCPFTGCRYNLYLEVTEAGSLRLPRANVPPEEMSESCALDVADRGPHRRQRIAHLLGLTNMRVAQVESKALAKVRAAMGSLI